MLKLFGVFVHNSVAHDLCTPVLYHGTKTHSLEKGKALIWAKERAVDIYASSGYAFDGGTRTRDPGSRFSSCGFLCAPAKEEQHREHCHPLGRKNRVNDLPCVVKCGGQRPVEVGQTPSFRPPPPTKSFCSKLDD